MMKLHFVTFFSPGTFMHEQTTKPIYRWDVDKAKEMAKSITERHNAKPFAFEFTTRARADSDLDSKVIDSSPMYYLGGKVFTIDEVRAREDECDRVLLLNMECNSWDRIIENTNSWKVTKPLNESDIILEWSE